MGWRECETPEGEQMSFRLFQCVSAGERILLFPHGFPALKQTFHLHRADKELMQKTQEEVMSREGDMQHWG